MVISLLGDSFLVTHTPCPALRPSQPLSVNESCSCNELSPGPHRGAAFKFQHTLHRHWLAGLCSG